MTDEGKEADLPPGEPAPETVAMRPETTPPPTAQTSGDGADPASTGRGGLNAQTRDRLAGQLRAMYDTIVQQPVPDRFAELIAKLEATDRK